MLKAACSDVFPYRKQTYYGSKSQYQNFNWKGFCGIMVNLIAENDSNRDELWTSASIICQQKGERL